MRRESDLGVERFGGDELSGKVITKIFPNFEALNPTNGATA